MSSSAEDGPPPITGVLDEILRHVVGAAFEDRRAFCLNWEQFGCTLPEILTCLEGLWASSQPYTTLGLSRRLHVVSFLADWAEWFPGDLAPCSGRGFLKTAVESDGKEPPAAGSGPGKLVGRLREEQRRLSELLLRPCPRPPSLVEEKLRGSPPEAFSASAALDGLLAHFAANPPAVTAPAQARGTGGFLASILQSATGVGAGAGGKDKEGKEDETTIASPGGGFSILAYRSAQIAAQWTLMDTALLRALHPRECVRKQWTRKECLHKSPNVLVMVELFNRRSYYAAELLLNAPDAQTRQSILRKLIDTLRELRKLNNWFSAYALLAGLCISPVHRLRALWSSLPATYASRFKELSKKLDSSRNFSAYRRQFAENAGKQLPQIPHLVVLLKDLFLLEEIDSTECVESIAGSAPGGKARHKAGQAAATPKGPKVINFFKFQRQHKVLANQADAQKLEPVYAAELPCIPEAFKGFANALLAVEATANAQTGGGVNDEGLWKRSYAIEPKQDDPRERLLQLERRFTGKRKLPFSLASSMRRARALAASLAWEEGSEDAAAEEAGGAVALGLGVDAEEEEAPAEELRQLLLEGFLKRSTRRGLRRFYFHLLSDLLIYSDPTAFGKLDLHQAILLHNCELIDRPDTDKERFAFQINSPQKSFVVIAESEQEKKEWWDKLSACVERVAQQGADSRPAPLGGIIAPVWAADHESRDCSICRKAFSMLNRRHHCRACGALVCGACSSGKLLLRHVDASKPVRVCDMCLPNGPGGDPSTPTTPLRRVAPPPPAAPPVPANTPERPPRPSGATAPQRAPPPPPFPSDTPTRPPPIPPSRRPTAASLASDTKAAPPPSPSPSSCPSLSKPRCAYADCTQDRVSRGYCAQHLRMQQQQQGSTGEGSPSSVADDTPIRPRTRSYKTAGPPLPTSPPPPLPSLPHPPPPPPSSSVAARTESPANDRSSSSSSATSPPSFRRPVLSGAATVGHGPSASISSVAAARQLFDRPAASASGSSSSSVADTGPVGRPARGATVAGTGAGSGSVARRWPPVQPTAQPRM